MKKQDIVLSLLILIIFFFGINLILNFDLKIQYPSDIQTIFSQDVKTSNIPWTLPTVISDNRNGTINWNTGNSISPAIATDKFGNIHVVWEDQTNLEGCSSADTDIFYAKYNSNTAQWSHSTVISDNIVGPINWNTGASSNPSIAVDNSGNIHVVWEDSTNLENSGTDFDIFYAKYSTDTAQWSQTSVISDNKNGTNNWNTGGSYNPTIAVDDSGNIHVAWTDTTNLEGCDTDYDIFYATYSTNTAQWSHATVISDNVNGTTNWNTGYSSDPSIAVDDSGNVHVVWDDYTDLESCDTDTDIFYASYSTDTAQWSHATVISDNVNGTKNWNTENSLNPSIDLDTMGNLHVVWYDYTDLESCGIDADIFYVKYNTNTAQWSHPSVISDNMNGTINWNTGESGNPVISLDKSDNICIAWVDSTDLEGCDTDEDVFFTRYSSTSGKWSQTTVISDNLNGTTNWNTGESEEIAIDVDNSGNVHVVWKDDTNMENSGLDNDIFYIKGIFQINSDGSPFIPGFNLELIIPLIGMTLIVFIYKYKRKF